MLKRIALHFCVMILGVCAIAFTSSAMISKSKPLYNAAIQPGDNFIDDERMLKVSAICKEAVDEAEVTYHIPANLLRSVALQESGRWHKATQKNISWPWTVNAEGKGYFFNSKREAIAKVEELQSNGVESIDVGCMQINLKHHPDAFSNLDEAFTPSYNVAYAGKMLKDFYERRHSWKEAVGDYHSGLPERGNPYAEKVLVRWNTYYNGNPPAQLASPRPKLKPVKVALGEEI